MDEHEVGRELISFLRSAKVGENDIPPTLEDLHKTLKGRPMRTWRHEGEPKESVARFFDWCGEACPDALLLHFETAPKYDMARIRKAVGVADRRMRADDVLNFSLATNESREDAQVVTWAVYGAEEEPEAG